MRVTISPPQSQLDSTPVSNGPKRLVVPEMVGVAAIQAQMDRISKRIQEIVEEVNDQYEIKTTVHQSTWSVRPDQPPPRRITKTRVPKNPARILALNAERTRLNELLVELGRKKAEALSETNELLQPIEGSSPRKASKDAIDWCVRTYKEHTKARRAFSQSGLAAEAVRKFFPEIPEFTRELGKTGRHIKNRGWLLKRESIRSSYLQKLPTKRKGRKHL